MGEEGDTGSESGIGEDRVIVLERTADTMWVTISSSGGDLEIITNYVKEGKKLVLRNLDIEGPGPGTLGAGYVGKLRGYARQLGRQEEVEEVIVEPRPRETGANPGHTTRPIRIRVSWHG